MTDALELYLLRHADAGDPEAWRGDDDLRPLSEKGERQAAALARFLAERRFAPDAILTSPRVRARRTAELLAEAIGGTAAVDERLARGPDLDEFDEVVRGGTGRRVVLVGHDPEFSEIAATLTGAPRLQLKKGALVRIDVELPLRPGRGVLRWLLPPDLFR